MAVFKLNFDADTATTLANSNFPNVVSQTANRLVIKTGNLPGFGVVTLEATGSGFNTNNPIFNSFVLTSSTRGLVLEISQVSLSVQGLFNSGDFLVKSALGGPDLVITGPGDDIDLLTFDGADRVSSPGPVITRSGE